MSEISRSSWPRLYINGRFLVQGSTGVHRFAYEVVEAVDRLLEEPENRELRDRVEIITPPHVEVPGALRRVRQIKGGRLGSGYAWEQIDLPRLSAGGVLLSLCNVGPVVKRRHVVVLHDASTRAFPQAYSLAFRCAYGVLIPAILRRAARLATDSEFSRDEISHWFGVPRSSLSVCYAGAEHILRTSADADVLARNHLEAGRYILAVGMGSANKNQKLLLDAFSRTQLEGVQLVFTGRRSARVHGSAVLEIPPGVVHVGHVSDPELRALYEGALSLAFPSAYEGFGLPPLEAMACGCPVVISNQPALIEIAGGAARVANMDDAIGFARELRTIAESPELRARLAAEGRKRASQFTWRRTAERLLVLCRAAV